MKNIILFLLLHLSLWVHGQTCFEVLKNDFKAADATQDFKNFVGSDPDALYIYASLSTASKSVRTDLNVLQFYKKLTNSNLDAFGTQLIQKLDDTKLKSFVADFKNADVADLNKLAANNGGLINSWKKLDDLGNAIPDAIRKNPVLLSKIENWSNDLFIKLGKVKQRNPKFFDNPLGKDIQKNPEILDFFAEGAPIIKNKSGNLKAVDLDMYAVDRTRTVEQRIFEPGTTNYVKNETRDKYANLHRIDDGSGTGGVNLQSGKIRDAKGNVIATDIVNGEGLMYVIDEFDNIHIGGRGGTISYPHPTLIGGENPNVKVAGMIQFKDGRIFEVNRNSGHFKPSPEALQEAKRVFTEKFPQNSFDPNFKGFIDGL